MVASCLRFADLLFFGFLIPSRRLVQNGLISNAFVRLRSFKARTENGQVALVWPFCMKGQHSILKILPCLHRAIDTEANIDFPSRAGDFQTGGVERLRD